MFDVGDSVVQASIITYLKLDQVGFRPAVASLCHSIETCDSALTTGAVNPGLQTRVCTVWCEGADLNMMLISDMSTYSRVTKIPITWLQTNAFCPAMAKKSLNTG